MTGRWLRTVLVAFALLGAAGNGWAQSIGFGCSTLQQNLFVRRSMLDLYLWYQTIPDVDPARYDSPEAYLDAIRYLPLDRTFSYIASRAANDAFFSNSQFIGFGFSSSVGPDGVRVTQVFDGSPAEEAGLRRGDVITAINGRTMESLIATGQLDAALGPPEAGVTANITFVRDGVNTAQMVKRVVTIPTVSLTRIYRVGASTVGYVVFRNFVEPSFDALDRAFEELRGSGVNELVLDVRYNGGGLVSVAQHLASLIGGVRTSGQVFASYDYNDKNTFRNRVLRFEPTMRALDLQRVVVITTRASASASELVINALRPFMPVLVVGERTYGKPVGQHQLPFCDKVLAPVTFSLKNADGQGDFFDGFQPTCPADDDLGHQFGDPAEASLKEAFTLLDTGSCSAPVAAERSRPRRAAPGRTPPDGLQTLIGAH